MLEFSWACLLYIVTYRAVLSCCIFCFMFSRMLFVLVQFLVRAEWLDRMTPLMTSLCMEEIISAKTSRERVFVYFFVLFVYVIIIVIFISGYWVYVPDPKEYISYANGKILAICSESTVKQQPSKQPTSLCFFCALNWSAPLILYRHGAIQIYLLTWRWNFTSRHRSRAHAEILSVGLSRKFSEYGRMNGSCRSQVGKATLLNPSNRARCTTSDP